MWLSCELIKSLEQLGVLLYKNTYIKSRKFVSDIETQM